MQPIIKKFIFSSFVIAMFVMAPFLKTPVAKAQSTGTVKLSASCTECQVGSTVAIIVSVEVSNGVLGAIEANLNYDNTKLKYVSVSLPTDFDVTLEQKIYETSGIVHLVRGKTGGLTGTAKIFVANFQAIASGDALFSASPLDGSDSDGQRILLTGGSVSITLKPVTPDTPNPPDPPDPPEPPDTPDTPDTPDAPTTPPAGDTTSTTTSQPKNAQKKNNSGSTTKKPADTPTIVHDYSKSVASYDKKSALADGRDKICFYFLVNDSGKTITDKKPIVTSFGGVDFGDLTLGSDNRWSMCVTSETAGSKKIMASIGGTQLFDEMFSFNSVGNVSSIDPVNILSSVKGEIVVSRRKDILKKNGFTNYEIISFAGKAEPNVKLRFYIHSPETIAMETSTNASGDWALALNKPLSVGNHRLEAAYIDKYGNESNAKLIMEFSITKSNIPIAATVSVITILLAVGFIAFYFIAHHRKSNLAFAGIPTSQIDLAQTAFVDTNLNLPEQNIFPGQSSFEVPQSSASDKPSTFEDGPSDQHSATGSFEPSSSQNNLADIAQNGPTPQQDQRPTDSQQQTENK